MASSALSIECSDQPLDLSFHPFKENLVAVALVDGTLELHDFAQLEARSQDAAALAADDDDDFDTIVSSTAVHTRLRVSPPQHQDGGVASCRTVRFASDGAALWTGGSGGDLVRIDAAVVGTFTSSQHLKTAVTGRIPDAAYGHSPIQVLHEINGRHVLVSGDEAGAVRLWDPRLVDTAASATSTTISDSAAQRRRLPAACVAGWKVHEDYVSGMEDGEDGNTLLVASADGTLSVYDLRMAGQQQSNNNQKTNNGLIRQSDNQDDELLSIKLMKNGKKVVCGTTEGVLSVFSYGTWGDVSDRFPGHPSSIDALVKVDEDTLLTGSSDGLIRVVSVHPDKFIGVLGDNHEGFPIEKLQFNANRNYVGSITHDNFVRLWDARMLQEKDDDEDDEQTEEDVQMSVSAPPPAVAPAAPAAPAAKNGDSAGDDEDDWEDMDQDMEEQSDDSSDDDGSDDDDKRKPESTNDKRAGRLKSDNEKFFDDL